MALVLENQALQQQVQQESNALSTMQQQLVALGSRPVAPPSRKCPVALPDKFGAKLANFPLFLAQCKLYMKVRQQVFPDDQTKVFILCLLKDHTAKWASPLLVADSPMLNNYEAFLTQFQAAFPDPQKQGRAN
ncbi:protein LDOC1-like [Eublepharis macularius]|uniref:Protein LDOC1-like n=1 Tax=Eublepharis macularius TaxID=481883 RepID=A0AA97LAP0_EUBMA|nr:protein LDOC1-like [Eublepharis macularius]